MAKFSKELYNQVQQLLNCEKSKLYDYYKRPSQDKINAYHDCMDDCRNHDGFNFRVLSANTFNFKCGFLYYDVSEETGEIERTKMVIRTRDYRKVYDVSSYIS